MKIVIGMPAYRPAEVCKLTEQCLQEVLKYNIISKIFEIRRRYGSSSVFSRNSLASNDCKKTHQKLDYDYYLSIDSDMAFAPSDILKLVKKYEALKSSGVKIGVIGGAYGAHGQENRLVAGHFEAVSGNALPSKWLPFGCTETVEVDFVGTGFMLIPTDIFESLEFPWFRAHVVTREDESTLTTEDIAICMDVKSKLNRSIWVDGSIRIAHISH